MQKKFVAVTLILIILLNTLSPNLIYAKEFVAATYVIAANEEPQDPNKSNNPDNESTIQEQLNKNGDKMMNNLLENALVEVRSESRTRMVSVGNSSSSSPSIIAGIISTILFTFPTIVNIIITCITNMFGTEGHTNNWFVIEDLVFNKYKLFDIDFFDIPNDLNNADTMGVLNYNIASWYFSLRNVAIVANLLILIYIGIRMAISTVAEQRARYKKMLINWFTSLFILFFMHFILAAMFVVQDWLVGVLKEVLNALESNNNRKRNWI